MLQLQVKIFQTNPGSKWILQVTANPPNGPTYFFQKDGFDSSDAAKMFFIANARLWAVNMGEV